MTGNTEARLKKVIQQFNGSAGLHVKHQVDSDKERTILNLIIGTSKALVCFKKSTMLYDILYVWGGRCFLNGVVNIIYYIFF